MGLAKRLQERTTPEYTGLDSTIQITSVSKKQAPASVVEKNLDSQHGYQELKEKIHRRLIDQLDLAKLESIPKEKLAAQVKNVIEDLLLDDADIGPDDAAILDQLRDDSPDVVYWDRKADSRVFACPAGAGYCRIDPDHASAAIH